MPKRTHTGHTAPCANVRESAVPPNEVGVSVRIVKHDTETRHQKHDLRCMPPQEHAEKVVVVGRVAT